MFTFIDATEYRDIHMNQIILQFLTTCVDVILSILVQDLKRLAELQVVN